MVRRTSHGHRLCLPLESCEVRGHGSFLGREELHTLENGWSKRREGRELRRINPDLLEIT